jgi:Ser/Thr protein kinase RdoA (MazF antagonist)
MSSEDSSQSVWGSEGTQFFHSLLPDKILQCAEKFGVKCTGRCVQLNSMENRVFDLEIDSESENVRDKFRVIKFYRPGRWSLDQIREEHEFLFDLVEVEDYPVVAPVKLESGETIYTDPETGLHCALFPKVGGRNVDEISAFQIPIIGRLLARMHVIGAKKEFKHRLKLNVENYGFNNLNLIEDLQLLPAHLETRYFDLADEIVGRCAQILEPYPLQRIHGDAHQGNVLDGVNGLFFVDFDDTVSGPPVQDIWLIVPGTDEYSKNQRLDLLEAYETFKTFDYTSLKLIEPLRTLRMIHFSAWIGKRYEDQAFKKAFPEYGTEAYWTEQIKALEEQGELF